MKEEINFLGLTEHFVQSLCSPSFSVACRTAASDGAFLCSTAQSQAASACRDTPNIVFLLILCSFVFCLLFSSLISLPDLRLVFEVGYFCLWWRLRLRPLSHSSSFFDCVIPFKRVNMQLQATQAHLPPFPLNSGTGRPCK